MFKKKLLAMGLIGALALTPTLTTFATDSTTNTNQTNTTAENIQPPPNMNGQMGQMQTPPDMNGQMGQMNQMGQMGDMQTPPDMNGEMGQMNQMGQMGDMQTPPDMNGEMGQMNQMNQMGQMGDMQTPPDMNGQEGTYDNQNPFAIPPFQIDGQWNQNFSQQLQNNQQNIFQKNRLNIMNGIDNIFNHMFDRENGGMSGQNEMPGEMSNENIEYTAANTLTEDSEGASYESSTSGENAVLVSGKTLSINDATVNKTGDTNGESSDFYGTNAAILASNGAELTVNNTSVTTNGAHANAIFSYGANTVLNVADTVINTTGNNSGGIMTTGGATTNATNLTVTTSGNSSAAIRSDRGGGTINVTKGSYSTSGVGSPAIYSTADITVSDATLSSTNSEAVVIEGGNSVTLNNTDATGNNATKNGQSTINTNVLIYQSMSGDASAGSSDFTMNGGSLTSLIGTMFHVTNVSTTITLNDVALTNASDDLLIASADAWGTSGKNGGNVTMNMIKQNASGNITVDSISSLALNITEASAYSGAINSGNDSGQIAVTLDDNSTWTLTGDSYITSFTGDYSNINTNGYHLYVGGTQVL